MVQKVARRRIDNILQGKKRIDTGIEKIDTAANASMEERIQAKKSAAKNKEPRDSNQVRGFETNIWTLSYKEKLD